MALTSLLGAVLCAAASQSLAGRTIGPDQDVLLPLTHRAYKDAASLRNKILIGYPDSGSIYHRPLSRFQLSVEICKLLTHIRYRFEGLEKIALSGGASLKVGPGERTFERYQKSADIVGSSFLEQKRLLKEFGKELTALGLDVKASETYAAGLAARVKKIRSAKKAAPAKPTDLGSVVQLESREAIPADQ